MNKDFQLRKGTWIKGLHTRYPQWDALEKMQVL